MARQLILGAFIFALPFSLSAADLGTHGPLFEITESDILESLKARLGEMEDAGEIDALKDEMQTTTRAYVNRPRPVTGLQVAQVDHTFEVDLSITLNRDLRDHNGRVFAARGTVVNPLDYSRFNKRIILFDGDDPAQVRFALSEGNELDTLLVLTNGAPLELMREHGRRFYFDQDAQMVKAFQITRIPSVVRRGSRTMLVSEVAMRGSDQ